MALVRQSDGPGLGVNPSWLAGTPGTFAVVGVSAYPRLVGGAGPAADADYDLPQLYISALTAHCFFCWLLDRYAYGGPWSDCWRRPTTNWRPNRRCASMLGRQPLATVRRWSRIGSVP
jgi:hypothetical protein